MRCYFLTEAAEQRPDASILREILRQINVIQYHCRRDFVPTKRRQRAKIEQFHQPLQRIRPWRRETASFPEPWKKYFVSEPVFVVWRWLNEWRFHRPDLVELRVVPRILHEVPVCDSEGDSREAEIDAFLADPKRRGRLNKLLGTRRWPSCGDREKELDELARKRMRAALAGDVEAEKTSANLASSPLQHSDAPVAQQTELRGSNTADEGASPSRSAMQAAPSCGMGFPTRTLPPRSIVSLP